MSTKLVDGVMFAEMVRCGAQNLKKNRSVVNELNVFPIPDGDTGDNMYMTISSGVTELGAHPPLSLSESSAALARGMLFGARGNSGVILSRIFAGIARGFEGLESVGVAELCTAFEYGIDEAYKAVAAPVEGTILTVFRDALFSARSGLGPLSTFESFFGDFVTESRRSLERTPQLLAVLREAGVVDSGGAGLTYIAEGLLRALSGDAISEEDGVAEDNKRIDFTKFTEDSVLEFGYCTELLLRLQRSKTDLDSFELAPLIEYLNSIGNSVVAFADGTVVKLHVHTMVPGEVLNYCQKYGEFLTVKIENMTLQHNEIAETPYTPPKSKVRKRYGVVSVASGEGLSSIFSKLGCDEVVSGGQSMNPSAQDFVRAFERLNADTVFVFPNNSNVILTARQAASLYKESDIRVLETRTVGEGYVAISMLDTSITDADMIVAELEEVISGVVTGVVCEASRRTCRDGLDISPGDFIGFESKQIHVSAPDRMSAVSALCDKLDAGKYDVLILLCGQNTPEEEREHISRELSAKYRRTEVITLYGGQPVYDYIIILE